MRKFYILTVIGLLSLQAYSQGIPKYCLENDIVHSYLTDFDYDTIPYTESRILKYCDNPPYQNHGVRKDQPKPVSIQFSKAMEAAGVLYVSEKADYSDPERIIKGVTQGVESIDVYNLIPGRIYNWKVECPDQNGSTSIVESGQFETTGTLRMLKIDNIFNVRDMGGWIGLKGYPLKYGKIIRGSRLNVNGSKDNLMITSSGIQELLRVGVRSELDMRDAGNAGNISHSFLGEDYPIYNVNGAYNSRIATFADAPQSIQGIKKLIEWLKADKPVYLHCSVGADRTGTVAYLVGALCGMSENALCKEFELTSFSSDVIENEAARGTNEVLVRQRNYVGRLDECSQKDSYKFANMVDKIKGFQKTEHPEWTLQQRVYWHLSTGVQGTYVPTSDLDWLINYMLNPLEMNVSGTVTMQKGDTLQISTEIVSTSALNPNPVVTYTSSDERVATISETGKVIAKACGTTKITASLDGFTKSVTISIPLIQSVLPDSVYYGNDVYSVKKTKNLFENGSFEYADCFAKWTSATGGALSSEYFEVKEDPETSECYLSAKADGDSLSAKSIRMQFGITSGTTYVVGFRIKNTSGNKVELNSDLSVSLVKTKPEIVVTGDDFQWDTDIQQSSSRADSREGAVQKGDYLVFRSPSYDGNWTEVQYVFKNEEGYKYCQFLFTHLGKDGDTTCFDNFYMSEVVYVRTAVQDIKAPFLNDDVMYNLKGQKTDNLEGIIIKNGKKYLYK